MLIFPAKRLRAEVIAAYVAVAGYRGCVCFSCGNASQALKDAGLYVVDVAPGRDLLAQRWWTPAEIRRAWPDLFDATSGHLPAHLMVAVARRFSEHLGELHGKHEVPTGSGETITCLRWAYPDVQFVARYNVSEATRYEQAAPLNMVVAAMSPGTVPRRA